MAASPNPPRDQGETTDLERLRAAVWSDVDLQDRLCRVTDETAFVAAVIEAGITLGFRVDAVEVRARMRGNFTALMLPGGLCMTEDDVPAGAWLPVKASWHGRMVLRWLHFGERRLREPFFEGEVRVCMRQPFNRLFVRTTPIEAAARSAERGLTPDGLVFHMSRCGSTLVAQMLAAMPDTIVVSEASPIDTIARLWYAGRGARREQLVDWLRWVVGALGVPRSGERRYVLKLDAWHALALPLFRAAFPATPWVFLYREPIEVLVSQATRMGPQMFPGMLAELGAALVEPCRDPLEHCARILASICEAALVHDDPALARFVDYAALPDAVGTRIVPLFGLDPNAFAAGASANVAARDAKLPDSTFKPDNAAKRAAATDEILRLAEMHLAPPFARLQAAE